MMRCVFTLPDYLDGMRPPGSLRSFLPVGRGEKFLWLWQPDERGACAHYRDTILGNPRCEVTP